MQISERRVVDTVPQAIQLFMMHRLLERLKGAVLAMETDPKVAQLLQESEDLADQRYILQQQMERLHQAAEELRFII